MPGNTIFTQYIIILQITAFGKLFLPLTTGWEVGDEKTECAPMTDTMGEKYHKKLRKMGSCADCIRKNIIISTMYILPNGETSAIISVGGIHQLTSLMK